MRRFLRGTEELEICLNAFDKSDVKTLLDSLTKARAKIKNSDRLKDINELLQSILKMPDSFRDYRKRLKEIDKKVNDVSRQVAGKALKVKRAAVPIKGAGTIRSGGLSNPFLQLDHGNLLIT